MQQFVSGNNFCKSEVQAQADSLCRRTSLNPLGGCRGRPLQHPAQPCVPFADMMLYYKDLPRSHLLYQNVILESEVTPYPGPQRDVPSETRADQ